ncbi:MAG: DUF3685 domain-containing protein [Synechococcus sp.]|nr:DUF3685 domain-containing protein [Synechococcus sp.]
MAARDQLPSALLLLLADPLQREGLRSWLQQAKNPWQICADPQQPAANPGLVIWSLSGRPEPELLEQELRALLARWQPAPLLLLLPAAHRYPTDFLLALPVQGLLEQPDREALQQAVELLLQGGRVLELADPRRTAPPPPGPALGLGGWLLLSGLQQIDAELRVCRGLLEPPPASLLAVLLLQGRQRELLCARRLLLWLWGPLNLAWSASPPLDASIDTSAATGAIHSVAPPAAGLAALITAGTDPSPGGLVITLRQRTADGLWDALQQRLRQAAAAAGAQRSGPLLALDGLRPERRNDLLLALLEQLGRLRERLRAEQLAAAELQARWRQLQPELRREALRQLIGTYVQLPRQGRLEPVALHLLRSSDLEPVEPELPDPEPMLATLLQARPMLVEGRLLAPDEPRALLYLELLLSDWLVRNAESISSELLTAAADWPELRRYLLRPDLLPTRNLERLRNQLNAQQRWSSWVERPIQIYESRRPLYRLRPAGIDTIDLSEPRDPELRQLGWLQQLVTLALESRDAIAPQLQSLTRRLGDLLVVLLSQVVGRAIGLVGRGIVQGMGRSGSRERPAALDP